MQISIWDIRDKILNDKGIENSLFLLDLITFFYFKYFSWNSINYSFEKNYTITITNISIFIIFIKYFNKYISLLDIKREINFCLAKIEL